MDTLLAVLTPMMLSYASHNVTDVLIDKEEAFCLAQNVYMKQKVKILQVNLQLLPIWNRVAHKKYPTSSVVLQNKQSIELIGEDMKYLS